VTGGHNSRVSLAALIAVKLGWPAPAAARGRLRRPEHRCQCRHEELIAARDWLTVHLLPPSANELNPLELVGHTWKINGQPGQAQHRLAHDAGDDPAQADAIPALRARRVPAHLDLAPFSDPDG
jgi:hypothetical protein